MRFLFIDRIDELEPRRRIGAIKALAMSEDYLGDHFPRFPVMPGVLMIESLAQAAQWLVRVSDGFAHSLIEVTEVRAVKFSDFVSPGSVLTIDVEWGKREGATTQLKARGTVEGRAAASARLVLTSSNLSDHAPDREPTDRRIIRKAKERFRLLYRGDAESIVDAAREESAIAS